MRIDSSLFRLATLWTAFLVPQVPSGRSDIEAATQDSFQAASGVAEPPKPTDDTNTNPAPVLRPIVLTEEGKKWIEKHKEVYEKTLKSEDGGLIDASTFISPKLRAKLFHLAAESKRSRNNNQVTIIKLNPPGNGYSIAFDVNIDGAKERWYVSQEPYYRDQFPKDVLLGNTHLAFWKGTKDGGVDKLTQTFISYYNLFQNGKLNTGLLLERLKQAEIDRESERNDEANIRNFDLPKDRSIGYIGLVDYRWEVDPIIRANYDDTKFFPQLMNGLGYSFVSGNDGEPIVVTRPFTPKQILLEQIRKSRESGIRDFYINIAAHGDETAMLFYDNVTKCPCNNLFPRDFIEIFNTFSDCTFTINPIPCYGGGLAGALNSYKDIKGEGERVKVFLRSKLFGTSQEGRFNEQNYESDIPTPFSMYYNVFLFNYLLSGKNYGEAHILADEASKKLVPCDPEVWKSTPNGGVRTSQINLGPKLGKQIDFYFLYQRS